MHVQFETVNEPKPGEQWKRCFERVWPSYERWFLSEGEHARTDLSASRIRLAQHMPELAGTYERLCSLAGDNDVSSRFLSMVDPPRYMAGCSQMAWVGAEPVLIRNYDFSPRLIEGVITRTEWVRPVLGVSEGTWGLLDGMNADGLAICLAFGGRKTVGKGFGIPLVVRYVLETCQDVPDACERLKGIPVHMAYSLTMVDAAGRHATVHLSPDAAPVVTAETTCTNHQMDVEWTEHAVESKSLERKAALDALIAHPHPDRASLIREFLRPPLFNNQYEGTHGTLYTAVYDPKKGQLAMHWPAHENTVSL
jgi:predicted choloylglycine hydrolase